MLLPGSRSVVALICMFRVIAWSKSVPCPSLDRWLITSDWFNKLRKSAFLVCDYVFHLFTNNKNLELLNLWHKAFVTVICQALLSCFISGPLNKLDTRICLPYLTITNFQAKASETWGADHISQAGMTCISVIEIKLWSLIIVLNGNAKPGPVITKTFVAPGYLSIAKGKNHATTVQSSKIIPVLTTANAWMSVMRSMNWL